MGSRRDFLKGVLAGGAAATACVASAPAAAPAPPPAAGATRTPGFERSSGPDGPRAMAPEAVAQEALDARNATFRETAARFAV